MSRKQIWEVSEKAKELIESFSERETKVFLYLKNLLQINQLTVTMSNAELPIHETKIDQAIDTLGKFGFEIDVVPIWKSVKIVVKTKGE